MYPTFERGAESASTPQPDYLMSERPPVKLACFLERTILFHMLNTHRRHNFDVIQRKQWKDPSAQLHANLDILFKLTYSYYKRDTPVQMIKRMNLFLRLNESREIVSELKRPAIDHHVAEELKVIYLSTDLQVVFLIVSSRYLDDFSTVMKMQESLRSVTHM